MKRADVSTIVSSFVVFVTFLLSIAILNFFIELNYNKNEKQLTNIANFLYEKLQENIMFLNNQTNKSSPVITIKNIGDISLDLACFKIYIDGVPKNFSYTINETYTDSLLNPGENAILNIEEVYNQTKYYKVNLVTCKGNKFETLIYFS